MAITAGGAVSFGPAPEAPHLETARDRATDFLRDVLDLGPVPSREVEEQATGAGISRPTLLRAKEALGVVSIKPNGQWCWALPASEGAEE